MAVEGTGIVTPGADYTAQERAALITFQLLEGAQMTTSEIAQRIGVTYHGARYMMEKVSRVVPVYEDGGRWSRVM